MKNITPDIKKAYHKMFIKLFNILPLSVLKEVSRIYIPQKKLDKHPFKRNQQSCTRLCDYIINKTNKDPINEILHYIEKNKPHGYRKILSEIMKDVGFKKYHPIIKRFVSVNSLNKKEYTKKMKWNSSGGFIYFIKENKNSDEHQSHIKIGYTKNLERRMFEFVVSIPYPLEFIHSFYSENALETERLLHSHFHNKHINGEWFELTNEDLLSIKLMKLPETILKSVTGTYFFKSS